MATAEVKEEQEVYVCLPFSYYDGAHILSWVLSHFLKDEIKIVATIIIPSLTNGSIPDFIHNRNMRDKNFDLERHLSQCAIQQFKAEKLLHQNDDQVEGILELIDSRAIKKLVMRFTPNCEMLASVVEKANPSCKIWFVHQRNLQLIRYPKSDLTEATSEEGIRREKLHQEENGKNDLLKRENKQLKLKNQQLRNKRNELDNQKQQLEKRISDLEIDYNKLEQERDNAVKEAQELRKQKEHSFANSDLVPLVEKHILGTVVYAHQGQAQRRY